MSAPESLESLVGALRACRVCRDSPKGEPLPHEPVPIIQAGRGARICIASQAPGTRAHASGTPFHDPSGVRLRDWLGLDRDTFYDASRIAIVPMGSCFPGLDAKGGDKPPRKECAPLWRVRIFRELPNLELILLIGRYAQAWHLKQAALPLPRTLTETVAAWRDLRPRFLPLPHPSWRNNAWLKKNPWFEAEILPHLRARIRSILDRAQED